MLEMFSNVKFYGKFLSDSRSVAVKLSNWQRKEHGEYSRRVWSSCFEGTKVNNTLDPFVRKRFFVLFDYLFISLRFIFYFDLPSVKNMWNTHQSV
jgi:hypothetical protein